VDFGADRDIEDVVRGVPAWPHRKEEVVVPSDGRRGQPALGRDGVIALPGQQAGFDFRPGHRRRRREEGMCLGDGGVAANQPPARGVITFVLVGAEETEERPGSRVVQARVRPKSVFQQIPTAQPAALRSPERVVRAENKSR
jgi:hypothetical protein